MTETIQVTVKNWEKFNERRDRKNYSWFRMQNDFFQDQKLFGLPALHRVTFIFLLCEASRTSKSTFPVNVHYATVMLGCSEKEFLNAIESLDMAAVIARESDGIPQEKASLQTDRQTDERTHEQTNERTNERTDKQTDKSIYDDIRHKSLSRTDKKTRKTKVQTLDLVRAADADASQGSVVWQAYSDAYFARYGFEPVRNAKVNSGMKQLAARLGGDAPEVARFYVQHNKAFYIQAQHTVGPLISDAEALHTQWKRGDAVLGSQAREIERRQHNSDAFEKAVVWLDQKTKGAHDGNEG